jgi:hypothetical protein
MLRGLYWRLRVYVATVGQHTYVLTTFTTAIFFAHDRFTPPETFSPTPLYRYLWPWNLEITWVQEEDYELNGIEIIYWYQFSKPRRFIRAQSTSPIHHHNASINGCQVDRGRDE